MPLREETNHVFVRSNRGCLNLCTNFGQLTRLANGVTFGKSRQRAPQLTRRAHHRKTSRRFLIAKDPTKKPPATIISDSQELENQIRQRAYELYEARGGEDGHDLEDWLRAQEEITAKTARGIAA